VRPCPASVRYSNQYFSSQIVPISTFGIYSQENPSKHWEFGRGGGDRTHHHADKGQSGSSQFSNDINPQRSFNTFHVEVVLAENLKIAKLIAQTQFMVRLEFVAVVGSADAL
jgi:hypothetical protein